MRKMTMIATLVVVLAACGGQTVEYSAQDGSMRATHKEGSNEWKLVDAQGHEPIADYDSMRVVEVSPDGHPMTVVYHQGTVQHWIQYYSTLAKRSEGQTINGQREGVWRYYHPNGNLQAEATFVGGHEEGTYSVYRDNGAPYYIGHYSHGVPVGTWEFYTPDGDLDGIRTYDDHGQIINQNTHD